MEKSLKIDSQIILFGLKQRFELFESRPVQPGDLLSWERNDSFDAGQEGDDSGEAVIDDPAEFEIGLRLLQSIDRGKSVNNITKTAGFDY